MRVLYVEIRGMLTIVQVIDDQGQHESEEDEGPVGLQLPLSPDINARM